MHSLPSNTIKELIVKPFFPENFLVDCRTQEARARVLAVSPVPLAATSLSLRPWTRLVHADSETLYAKVKLEVTGIPAHAWKLATVRKLLAPFCWVERLDAATEDMSDMSQFTLTAWTKEPAAIPTARKLLIAERERPTHADPEMQLIFGRVTPCLRQKIVLSYNIQIHLRSIADFTPRMPLTFSSSPSVDGGSGPNGNSERSYGSRGGSGGPRLMRFARRDNVAGVGVHGGRSAPGGARHVVGGPDGAAQGLHKVKTTALVVEPSDSSSSLPKENSNARNPTTACTSATPAATGAETAVVSPSGGVWGAVKDCKAAAAAEQLSILRRQSIAFELQKHQTVCPQRVADPMLLEASNHPPTPPPQRSRVLADHQGQAEMIPAALTATVSESDPVYLAGSATPVVTQQQRVGQKPTAVEVAQSTPFGPSSLGLFPNECSLAANPANAPPLRPDEAAEPAVAETEEPTPTGLPLACQNTCNGPSTLITAQDSTTRVAAKQDQGSTSRTPVPDQVDSFIADIRKPLDTPIVSNPFGSRVPATPPPPPPPATVLAARRSSARLANGKLAKVPAAKRGEIILMRRFDIIDEAKPVTSEAKAKYENVYRGGMESNHVESVQEMFPTRRSAAGRGHAILA
ncbi:unnamed protein product [Urochloa humidicola]